MVDLSFLEKITKGDKVRIKIHHHASYYSSGSNYKYE